MPNQDPYRPWTEELIPEPPENPTQKDLLIYIACAMRRQLQVIIPEGTEMVDGEPVMPDP